MSSGHARRMEYPASMLPNGSLDASVVSCFGRRFGSVRLYRTARTDEPVPRAPDGPAALSHGSCDDEAQKGYLNPASAPVPKKPRLRSEIRAGRGAARVTGASWIITRPRTRVLMHRRSRPRDARNARKRSCSFVSLVFSCLSWPGLIDHPLRGARSSTDSTRTCHRCCHPCHLREPNTSGRQC